MKHLREIFEKAKFFIDKDGYAVPGTHLTWRDVNMSMDEDVKPQLLDWVYKNDNHHIGEVSDVSKHLKSNQPDISPEHIKHIKKYTDESGHINRHLIQSHKKNTEPTKYSSLISNLDKATNNPIKDHIHLYSGIGFHPGKMLSKTKDSTIHLPAYTSMTHDKSVARGFAQAQGTGLGLEKHILHIHMKPGDKMLHISHVSEVPSESESILPRNTKLNINPQPDFHDVPGSKIKHYVWHAEVAGQE